MSRPRLRRTEDGVVAILMSLMTAGVFLGLAALVVNLGMARDTKQASQISSDASALAAANVLYPTGSNVPNFSAAIGAAKNYALVNFHIPATQWTGCTDAGALSYRPDGGNLCISFDDVTKPTKVRVTMPTVAVAGGFGNVYGTSQVDISTSAEAVIKPSALSVCGLCVVGSSPSDLGNGNVTVTGGSIHFNGTVSVNPGSNVSSTGTGAGIDLCGASPTSPTVCTKSLPSGNFTPKPTSSDYLADPLKGSLTFPLPGTSLLSPKTNPCTDGPGIYTGSPTLPKSTCTLSPGLYVITGTWTLDNNTILAGTGVTLFATCNNAATYVCSSPGQSGGSINGKNGDTKVSAPTSGPLKGLAIVYHPNNKSAINLQGNGNSAITGTIYAPSSEMDFPGNSCFTVTNGPIITGSLYSNGTKACMNLNYTANPNMSAIPGTIWLDQ